MRQSAALLLASLLALPAALQAAEPAHPTTLHIQGSNTVGYNLAPELLKALLEQRGYRNLHTHSPGLDELTLTARNPGGNALHFQISSHGTRTGFAAMQQGKADMVAASRPITLEETAALSGQADLRNPKAEHVIGVDGLAIITHPSNPINSLTTSQLADLFAGKLRDWSELGAHKGPIHLYARDENSGTWDTFRSLVLDRRQLTLAAQAKRFESSEQLADQVAADPQGIGFVSLRYVRNAHAVAISDGNMLRSMLPTVELVASEDYPLSRRLYLYAPPGRNEWAQALADFAESDEGQQIVADQGFVPQKVLPMPVKETAGMPATYTELVRNARRLNTTFRFADGSTELDSKALRDVERVVEYLKSHDKLDRKVVLVGFDARQSSSNAQMISRLRAIAVQRQLAKAGVLVRDNLGLGDAVPVADNKDEDGRLRNRRVEIWVY